MKKLLFLLFLALTLICHAAPGQAAVTFFTDRASFEAALTNSTLIDFEDPNLPREMGSSYTIGEATFQTALGLYSSGPGRSQNWGTPSTMISAENFGPLTISLGQGFHALGMEFGEIFESGIQAVFTLTGDSGVLDSGSFITAKVTEFNGPNTTFYGWISDGDGILSLQWDFEHAWFPSIDNVIYGNGGAPVPIPGALLLLGSGLAGLGALRRKLLK